MILECRPDYFKVDRYLVNGSCRDYHRRSVLSSIVELARRFGADAVAEGVDNVEDLRTTVNEGFTLIQGFLFGHPGPVSHLGGRTTVARAAQLIPLDPVGSPWVDRTDLLSFITAQLLHDQQVLGELPPPIPTSGN